MSDKGFEVTVKVTPNGEVESNVAKGAKFEGKISRVFQLAKGAGDDDKRQIVCVAMVADEIDAHGDSFTPEAVEGAANSFMQGWNLTKELGRDHTGERPDVDLVGSWFTESGGTFDGLEAPANSWVAKIKVNDDDTWADVKSGAITGLSIEGPAWGYEASSEVAKSSGDEAEGDEAPELKRVFTKADPRNLDLVDQGANCKVLIWKKRDKSMADKTEETETVKTEAVKGKDAKTPEPKAKSEEVEKAKVPELALEIKNGELTAESVEKAKKVTATRQLAAATLFGQALANAKDLGVDVESIYNPPDEVEGSEVSKAMLAELKKMRAEATERSEQEASKLEALSKKFAELEAERSGSAVNEGDGAGTEVEKKAGPFGGASFSGFFGK